MVLVHGGLVDSRRWDDQMTPLSRRFRVVHDDLRGYGRWDAPAVKFSHIEDLRALVDFLDIERATLTSSIRGARKVVIAGASHHPPVDTPEQFNRLLMGFLR